MEREIVRAGVGADRQTSLPRLPAVDGLVDAAFAARREQRSLRGDVHDVRVPRVDQQLTALLRGGETHALPRLPCIRRFVDPVAEIRAALPRVLPPSLRPRTGILRSDRDAA